MTVSAPGKRLQNLIGGTNRESYNAVNIAI
jgi:hypothetical protein